MKFRALILPAISLVLVPASALANWVALDGNRNPFNFLGLQINGAQEQQVAPSDANGNPYSQSNPQFFDLMLGATLMSPGPQSKASSLPIAAPTDPDIRISPSTINAVDTLSSTTTGQNGAAIITGSPTANSYLAQAINGASTIRIQLSGSWSGTLSFEQSIDGGATYGAMSCHVNGTVYSTASITGNGIFDCEVGGATDFRVRATALSFGTAVVTETITSFVGVVKTLNPVAIKDNASGNSLTIKAGSAAPQASDPSAVVGLSPNTGEVGSPASGVSQPTGGIGISGWLSGIYKALTGNLSVTAAPIGVTSTDYSWNIQAGGSYQTAIAASGTRKGCLIQNPTTATEVLNVKFGTMVTPFTLLAGMSIGCNQGNLVLQDAITVMGATTGHVYSALAQ